ncbi:cupin domain-containing protein [Foetidibacter luteolus]|uniref:cupin domain-containing protein n=1 Tax=Foetidibacter luteolus TaxID=2608880 RepID=UPI001A98673F|nr:cupin domain-containing protein [Foetidibacter luteolus]
MKSSGRRLALRQMLLFTMGGSVLLNSCKSAKNSGVVSGKPLQSRHVPAGTISPAADGIVAGAPKIRSEFTNGQFCCQEVTVQPKFAGPPPHLHKELDEIMYVIEGTAQVMVGDTVTEVRAGDYHLRPHGIVHTFWNSEDVPVRFIDMYLNQDFISYFEEFARTGNNLKSKGLGINSSEGEKIINDLNQKFGVEIFFDQYPPLLQKYGLKT